MRVLVTGGAGYIGSHTLVALIESGHEPIVVDNLCNSSRESLYRVTKITGKNVEFHEFDVCDTTRLTDLLAQTPCDVAIHFAGLKAVGESVEHPVQYYRNNIDSTLSLIEAVSETSTEERPPRIIFSSSATVYGEPKFLPLTEEHPVGQNISNPYGQTKYMCEQILFDAAAANPDMQAIALRYFNPIGAHPSGLIGEDPKQTPNNLAPYIAQVAVGRLECVGIFGDDYDTVDGTGVRDYIHVVDLADGHVKALHFSRKGLHAFNISSGTGTSVNELLEEFEKVTGHPIERTVMRRRAGDVAEVFADSAKARKLLKWTTQKSLSDAVKDSLTFQRTGLLLQPKEFEN